MRSLRSRSSDLSEDFKAAPAGLFLRVRISEKRFSVRWPEKSNIFVFIFIAIIRTISFIAVGVFFSLLVARLREQRESLREANANLSPFLGLKSTHDFF